MEDGNASQGQRHQQARRHDSHPSLRARAITTRERMRQSPAWKRMVALLSSLSLLAGHQRPREAAARFAAQRVAEALAPLEQPASDAAEIAQIEAHIQYALAKPHPLEQPRQLLSQDTQAACAWLARHRDSANALRQERFNAIQRCALDLECWNAEFQRGAPRHIRESALPLANIALIDAIIYACDLPDEQLPNGQLF